MKTQEWQTLTGNSMIFLNTKKSRRESFEFLLHFDSLPVDGWTQPSPSLDLKSEAEGRLLEGRRSREGCFFSDVSSANHTLMPLRFVPFLQGCG